MLFMRKILWVTFLMITSVLIFLSCQKEKSCENCNVTNKVPIANAGSDTMILLPVDSILLNGTTSVDPDGNITAYQWSKIFGPPAFSISNSTSATTVVKNLVQGTYLFELKVTDDKGLTSKDTVIVTVNTEIIFNELVWITLCYQPDVPGACWINSDSPSYGITINDTANILPNSATATFEVWIRMDTSRAEEKIPRNCWQYPDPYPQSNYTYCLTPDGLSIWSWFFSPVNLGGRKADIIIRF